MGVIGIRVFNSRLPRYRVGNYRVCGIGCGRDENESQKEQDRKKFVDHGSSFSWNLWHNRQDQPRGAGSAVRDRLRRRDEFGVGILIGSRIVVAVIVGKV